MKLNIEVDLSDFYPEHEELTLAENIKQDIAYKVKAEIWKTFQKESLQSFDNQVKRQIELDKDLKIKETVDEVFKNKQVKSRYNSGQMLSIEDYIKDEMERYNFNNNDFIHKINGIVETQAKKVVDELKNRYDMIFASQIVHKLNEQGMLKEDIAKILLDK